MSDHFRIQPHHVQALSDNLKKNNALLEHLKANMPPRRKPTRWERFTWRVLHYRNRVRDAWLVLIGKKDACDYPEF